MKTDFDAVIVGGGHNGLVCGTYLAKAGVRVLVLERRSISGGAAVTEEVWPGYRLSTASYYMGLLRPKGILNCKNTAMRSCHPTRSSTRCKATVS